MYFQSSKDVQRVATWSEVFVYNGTKDFKKRYKAPNNLHFSLVVRILYAYDYVVYSAQLSRLEKPCLIYALNLYVQA